MFGKRHVRPAEVIAIPQLTCQHWNMPAPPAAIRRTSLTLPGRGSPAALLGLVWDVGLPMVSFYGLRLAGASEWAALLTATLFAGARVGWVAWKSKRLTLFGALMMLVFGIGLAMAFVSGDPRILLAKNSVSSTVVGTAFLVSLAFKRPLTLIAFQTWRPEQADAYAAAYDSDPALRAVVRRAAWAWGVGMMLAAVLRLPIIYLLPLDVTIAASAVPGAVIMGGLGLWTISLLRRQNPFPPDDAAQTVDHQSPQAAVEAPHQTGTRDHGVGDPDGRR